MIEKLTRPTVDTVGIAEITDISVRSPPIRKRRGLSGVLLMQRSGVISITLQGMIWSKTFLDQKKMLLPPAPVPQEPHWSEHRQVNPDGDEQMEEINMIFGGSMSIALKTQGKKLEREISLA
jgi:hypothetical protein